ncbi:hypothetical protein L2U69_10040 [Zavarzinia compransoris]|uniref:hypothetical protein n=1 Tax=Zavarzinia marina TaxID=2911065 RepID=UPI001F273397|nr:hypothetical protein [Zavarzinia marina]MCF4165983.1 hypothetical protein [Zavarzinia marina]
MHSFPVLSFAVLCAALMTGACAKPRPAPAPQPAPDVTAPARAAFGDHMERYHGGPLTRMIDELGPPTQQRDSSDGGKIAVWRRKGEVMVKGEAVDQQCDVTALVGPGGKVDGIVGGGNILFCVDSFVPPSVAVTPPPPVDLYALPSRPEDETEEEQVP